MQLFQFGKGNIGRTLIRQIVDQQAILASCGVHLEYVGFCGRSEAVLCPGGLHQLLTDDRAIDEVVPEASERFTYSDPMAVLEQVIGLDLPDLCVIDTTAADLTDIHLACLRQDIGCNSQL